jgi:hypothetical protein
LNTFFPIDGHWECVHECVELPVWMKIFYFFRSVLYGI